MTSWRVPIRRANRCGKVHRGSARAGHSAPTAARALRRPWRGAAPRAAPSPAQDSWEAAARHQFCWARCAAAAPASRSSARCSGAATAGSARAAPRSGPRCGAASPRPPTPRIVRFGLGDVHDAVLQPDPRPVRCRRDELGAQRRRPSCPLNEPGRLLQGGDLTEPGRCRGEASSCVRSAAGRSWRRTGRPALRTPPSVRASGAWCARGTRGRCRNGRPCGPTVGCRRSAL